MSDKKQNEKGAKPRRGRPPKNPETPHGGRSTILVGARLSPELAERLDKFWGDYNKSHPRTEKSAHVEQAIAEYLNREEAKLPTPD